MQAYEEMKKEWKIANEEFQRTPGVQKLISGTITIEDYKAILRQIFHHARENPQIQATATSQFRGPQREVAKMFYKHAVSEIGHDYLALSDLKNLGTETAHIPSERPLPSTRALIAFAYHQIMFENPVGYLGYLFFLEYTPVQSGARYQEMLRAKGVPEEAMSFIDEHATVDVAHCRLMEKYVNQLVKTAEELDEVIYVMKATARLYGNMVAEAIEKAAAAHQYGIAHRETVPCPEAQPPSASSQAA